jgi:hypothetical protein
MTSSNADTLRYREGYPGKRDDVHAHENYNFFAGKRSLSGPKRKWSCLSQDDDETIDHIITHWKGNYKKLEARHDFIQWLFPIRELSAFNGDAQSLQLHEAERIQKEFPDKVQAVYELMLDFYGMQLLNAKTGVIGRKPNHEDCYANLNSSGHNYLRITRILKSLGEMGLSHYQYPFCRHFVDEFRQGSLLNCADSCQNYWIQVIKDDEKREQLARYIEESEAIIKEAKKNRLKGMRRNPTSDSSDTSRQESIDQLRRLASQSSADDAHQRTDSQLTDSQRSDL